MTYGAEYSLQSDILIVLR